MVQDNLSLVDAASMKLRVAMVDVFHEDIFAMVKMIVVTTAMNHVVVRAVFDVKLHSTSRFFRSCSPRCRR